MNKVEIEFEDIQRVNKEINGVDIKGKSYALVNDRINAFRMLFPNGAIKTEMLANENGMCVFKAEVYSEYSAVSRKLLGVGHAYEREGSSFINKTSYIENCETSAIGRALAMCGIGIDVSVASYEEVANAIENQKEDLPVRKIQIDQIKKLYSEAEIKKMLSNIGVSKLEKITNGQAEKMIDARQFIANDSPTY